MLQTAHPRCAFSPFSAISILPDACDTTGCLFYSQIPATTRTCHPVTRLTQDVIPTGRRRAVRVTACSVAAFYRDTGYRA